ISNTYRLFEWLAKYAEKDPNKEIIREGTHALVMLIAPFAPHTAEELWSGIGEKGFVSMAQWPNANTRFIDKKAERGEELVEQTISDIRNIQQLVKIEKVKKITILVSPKWKWDALSIVQDACNDRPDYGAALKALFNSPFKRYAKELEGFAKQAVRIAPDSGTSVQLDEEKLFLENKKRFQNEFDAIIEVVSAEKSQNPKARNAFPFKPAIVIE
ncbi:MAG: class I tRNA ligase family protein, partial [Candidatus Diapherotrites archaeon]|nr:class I tRNA ligase family protein [Candidatus Diapherotrites archaeon]